MSATCNRKIMFLFWSLNINQEGLPVSRHKQMGFSYMVLLWTSLSVTIKAIYTISDATLTWPPHIRKTSDHAQSCIGSSLKILHSGNLSSSCPVITRRLYLPSRRTATFKFLAPITWCRTFPKNRTSSPSSHSRGPASNQQQNPSPTPYFLSSISL